jgi:hypothetical protein
MSFVVDKVALEQVFLPSTCIFPCQYDSTNAPTHLHYVILIKGEEGENWERSKQYLSGTGKHWVE